MSVEIIYKTHVNEINERLQRNTWLKGRIPTNEYFISVRSSYIEDVDDFITTKVNIWADDAEIIATEFWFKFP